MHVAPLRKARKKEIISKEDSRELNDQKFYIITKLKNAIREDKMNKKTVLYIIVFTLIGILVGAAIGWVAKPIVTGPAYTGLKGTIKVGWIDGITGANAFWGEQGIAASEIALDEVNHFLEEIGAGWRMELVVEDSQTKPEVALDKLKSLHAQGITIVGGWGTSEDLKACMSYADSNKILLLSYGSNAMELAEDDYVYRLLPTVAAEGGAVASILKCMEVEYVIPVWVGNAWGDSEVNALREACEEVGIEVDEGIRYSPEATEFSAEASVFNSKVQDAIAQYGAEKVAWWIACFEEGKAFYEALAAYDPVSWGIKWVTSEGPTLTDWVVETPIIAEMVSKADCIFPITVPTMSGKLREFQEKMEARLGIKADIYGINAYDCVWIMALGLLAADKYDADAVRAVLPMIFDIYQGAAGWSPIDENGDRVGRNYGLYKVMEIEGAYRWARVGEWNFGTEEISWLPTPEIVY